MANQAPAHWSKDFVEHLRTVHFALIAISAGLALLLLSSHDYNAVSALVQIEEVIGLKNQWSLRWIRSHTLKKVLHSTPFRNSLIIDVPVDPLDQSTWYMGLADVQNKKHATLACHFPRVNWWPKPSTGCTNRSADECRASWSVDSFPPTLNEFRTWWNELRNSYVVLAPSNVGHLGFSNTNGTLFVRPDPIDIDIVRPGIEVDLEAFPNLATGYDGGRSYFNKEIDIAYVGRFDWNRQHMFIVVPITEIQEDSVNQESVRAVFPSLRTGIFERSFPDLSVAALDKMDLRLEDARDFIHDEASKGSEVFEAFGMKFPAGQITLWGMILLLSVQLYFFVYLRQLSGKLKADDPGWDTPWIGMDSSHVSKAILYASFVLLPCVTSIALGCQAARRLSSGYWEPASQWFGPIHFLLGPWHWDYRILLKIFLLVLSATASGYLGFQCWKYRPQIAPEPPKPPSCPAQLFE